MEECRQATTVEATPEGQIRVRYNTFADDLPKVREFVFEAPAAEWFAEQIVKAANDDLATTAELLMPPDEVRVWIGGGHRYDDVNVNASNQRDPESAYGKLYVLSAMTCDVARTLADQIRILVQQL